MIHYSNVNYNKRSKRNNNNHNHKCNEKRTKRRNQFNHIRLHSYDENIQNYYHEDGEFSTDVTYLPLSELNHSLDPLKDDTALVHSVFAVVAARLRQKHNGSKSIIKKVSEYEKLSQDHDDNHKNNHENKSKSNQTNKQIHQHIRLASYISNDIPKQSKSKEINNKDEQQLWRLCIKWNPKDLSNKSTLNPTNTYDNNNNISNENTHQFKLKKTHIFATLGTEIDKTSVYSDHSTVSLISLDIHGIDRLEKKRQSFQHHKYSQKRLIQQYINDTKQKSIICSVCQRLINVNSNEQALSVLYDNRKMNNMGQMNMNNDLISEQIRTDQISFDKRYKGKCKLNQNSNSQSHEIHDYPSYCLTKCNNIQYKRNSCHILTNHNINWEKFKHDYNTTTTNNTTYNNPIQYRDYYYYPRKIPDNIDHDQFNYGSKLWINSLDQTISTSMLHCQQCLYNKLNKGCNKQGYLNGSCNNNNNSNELSKVHIKSNCIHGNSNSVMYCCNQCKQWFIPLWNQLYYSRNKRHISKDDNLIHRSYNHHCYHRSSSQPLTKHERIIQNHLSKNNRYNYNNSDTIQCSTVQHRIPINQQSYKRQSKHRHRRTKRRAKSHLPIQRFISNDTNNQVNDTSIQFNHYKLESYRSQKEIDCQPVVNNSDKFIVDPFLDPYEHLINLKQDHKLKHHNRKYLGQLNVQEWLDKTITSNY
ncbi:hypothetical protein Smp_131290 [Schistosoma mansoni]|uniref:hypothetical protein n=1 Tax=Schistosoma mansoni TaxID=6183 RepID=UPI0001A6358C|nr:hypothetical protein Smp_131290 [Schistosoma mansoni]|eukprot:XP_018653373.1 hypothetical protein Smp_131290 [Schistosoma mansoni]